MIGLDARNVPLSYQVVKRKSNKGLRSRVKPVINQFLAKSCLLKIKQTKGFLNEEKVMMQMEVCLKLREKKKK